MKNLIKKSLICVIVITVLFTGVDMTLKTSIVSNTVDAHSGRTDSNGGHRNSKTGGYHYHCGGNPAHQHNNGICPYDSIYATPTPMPSYYATPTPIPTTFPIPTTIPEDTKTMTYNACENNIITLQKYTFDGKKVIGIQVLDYISGEEANNIIAYENPFNTLPKENEKWILVKIHIQFISGINTYETISATDILFSTSGSLGCFYNSNKTETVNKALVTSFSNNLKGMGQFEVNLSLGGEADVWYGILVDTSIEYVTFKIATSPYTYAWFSTEPFVNKTKESYEGTSEDVISDNSNEDILDNTTITDKVMPNINILKTDLCLNEIVTLEVMGTTDSVTWLSSNESVAVVDENGLVTAIKEGYATISANVAGVVLTSEITVKYPSISKSKVTIYVGENIDLKIKDEVAPVLWKSSDELVSTVSSQGKITALNKGKTTITAITGNVILTSEVTVKQPYINKKILILYVGNNKKLFMNGITNGVIWSSSNKSIATVSSKGIVNAKKAGSVVITATVGNNSYKCNLKVKE